MFKQLSIITLLLFAPSVLRAQGSSPSKLSPIRIILVGDSTIAVHSGWGQGFCADVVPEVTCLNVARGGRSSGSYRAEGLWAKVLDELKQNANFQATYVLIQFGHNDQPGKPGRTTDLVTEFPANMKRYVEDLKSAGAKPVLITPLTRRSFKLGVVRNDLIPWADATMKVAEEEGVPVLDLNSESAAAIQKMGPVEANTLAAAPPPSFIAESAAGGTSLPAPKPAVAPVANPGGAATSVSNPAPASKPPPSPIFDYTHLGDKGAAFFGRMVANELVSAVPELKPYIKPQ